MYRQKIINGLIFNENFTSEENAFTCGTVYICGEKIVSANEYNSSTGEECVIDADGQYVIPGLTDIHFHGCMGSDCCDASVDALRTIAKYELKCGITSITPATLTMPEETLSRICAASKDFYGQNDPDCADFCGLYMEGPFINCAKKGAQNEKYVVPADTALLNRLQDISGGIIRTVTVAPETKNAMDFIRENSGRINISIAHTAADYETAKAAFLCGASQLTHTYNAMPPFTHRAPGPIGAAADDAHCMAELICDGIHVHPAVVRATFKLFGDDRIIFISDSLRAAGLADGHYELGGQTFTVKGNLAVLDDGTIAGSVTNLMECVRTAVRLMGIPLASAIKCAAVNPAKAVGIYDNYGSIAIGKYANIVILDKNLELKMVLHRGMPAAPPYLHTSTQPT